MLVYTDVSDYLMCTSDEGIYGLHIDPTVTSQPFPPITTVSKVTAFDINFENNTLIFVSNKQLKQVSFNNNKVMNPVTAVNTSGLFCLRM